jgi:hypothetical protein
MHYVFVDGRPLILCIHNFLMVISTKKWPPPTPVRFNEINSGFKFNCQFDSPPLKVESHTDLLVCRWHATYCWKALDKAYNFTLELISIGGLHTKLRASKVAGVPISRTSKLQLGSPKTKWHLGLALWPGIKNIIRGKVMASPKSGLWWVLWIYVCSWFIHAPKVLPLCINQLVVWFMQVCVNNWLAYHLS